MAANGTYEKGLNRTFWLKMATSLGAAQVEGQTLFFATPNLSLKAALDFVQFVPWANIGLGTLLAVETGGDFDWTPGLVGAIGIDYLIKSETSLGMSVSRFQGLDGSQTELTITYAKRWGFF